MLFERKKQETFNEASLNFPKDSKGKRRENFMRLKEVGRGFGEGVGGRGRGPRR